MQEFKTNAVKYFKAFIAWVLVSSENPQAASLTVKGVLVWIGTKLVILSTFGIFQHLQPDVINVTINYLVFFTQDVLYVVSYAMAGWGIIRKIINTFYIPDPTTPVAPPTKILG